MIRTPLSAALALALLAGPAAAYVGPGAGLGAIGTVVGLLVAVLLLVVGFVWFPVKRMLRKRRAAKEAAAGGEKPAE